MVDKGWFHFPVPWNVRKAIPLIYAIKFDFDSLLRYRIKVIHYLKSEDFTITKDDNSYFLNTPQNIPENKLPFYQNTIEELGIINYAITLGNIGYKNYNKFSELKNGLIQIYNNNLNNNPNRSTDIINIVIPNLSDLFYDEDQSHILLNKPDQRALEEIILFGILKAPKHQEKIKSNFFLVDY